jgi:signal transduction histidine kinase/RimJ/RimL family protein N-acetyltransferase
MAAFVVVGLILFWRKSADRMGILASLMLIAVGIGFTANLILLPIFIPGWHGLVTVYQAFMFGAIVLFLFWFPNGRFYPTWTRPVLVGWIVYAALWLIWPKLNPHRASSLWPVAIWMGWIWVGVVAQIVRYRRRSDTAERQQTKWVIAGFAGANISLLLIIVLFASTATPGQTGIGGLLAYFLFIVAGLGPTLIPVTISMALFRYRLWQIDFFINRTIVYGGLTAAVLASYGVIVGGLSAVVQTQNSLFLSLLATGLIAVLFQPVRNRLQLAVNRLMFGERDDPYAVLSQLGRQLRETAVPGETLPALTTTIRQVLKLPYVAVELTTADGGRQTAAVSGRSSPVIEEWPLLYQGERVGRLTVSPRSPQERFSERERQLLADIAGQAGAAAYSVRLMAALQRSRERLVLAREEERRRIRRDLHDELGPSLASQTFKLDAALELLERDPQAAAVLLESLKSENQALIADIRRLVYALRPPSLDELGLLAALQVHLAPLAQRNGSLSITITAVPDPLLSLPAAVEVAAYRIVMEAINNVTRHARAQHCMVHLEISPASLMITVADDGIGLPPELRPGVGLAYMRERAEELGGSFSVGEATMGGVQVTAVLPLMELCPALPEQLPLVMEIIGEAAAWLAAKGIDQWPSPPNEHWWRRVERQIANGEMYLAMLNNEAIGTLRLIWSDPYWPAGEYSAGYVHSLAIRNRAHGLKIGTALLGWAMEESRRRGRQLVRLDCAAGNGRLRRYYEELGFTYCGQIQDDDYVAALYEMKL